MSQVETSESNEQAFRRMKADLDGRFPAGHLIAFDNGRVIADTASFQEMRTILLAAGKSPREVFVVQAGADYPEFATILCSDLRRE